MENGCAMKIPLPLRSVAAGPVPALACKTGATISTVTAQGRPRVAPLQSFRSGEPNFVETARRACGKAPPLGICLSLFLSGCAHQEESTPKVVVEVKVERVQVADLRISVRAPAAIHPREQANIASRLTAPI